MEIWVHVRTRVGDEYVGGDFFFSAEEWRLGGAQPPAQMDQFTRRVNSTIRKARERLDASTNIKPLEENGQ